MLVADTAGRKPKIRALKYPDPETGTHYISSNESCIIEYVVEDYEIDNGEQIPVKSAGKVSYYINGDLVETRNNVFAYNI